MLALTACGAGAGRRAAVLARAPPARRIRLTDDHPSGTKEYRTMSHTRWRGAAAPLLGLAVLGAGLGLLARPGLSAQDGKAAPSPLDGIWKGVAITAAGNPVPEDEAKLLELTFAGAKVTAA